MIGARIKCDHCGFIGEMEINPMSKSSVTTPSGWASVYPSIRIKGERDLKDKERKALKEKLKEHCGTAFHVCPACIFGEWKPGLNRLLPMNPAEQTA